MTAELGPAPVVALGDAEGERRHRADSSATPNRSGCGPPTMDSVTTRLVITATTARTGRLMKKAQRQPPASMSTAPRDGPVATARAEMPPHMATAWARSAAGVAPRSSASDAGMSSAAPTACTTRPPMSIHGAVATPHSSDPSGEHRGAPQEPAPTAGPVGDAPGAEQRARRTPRCRRTAPTTGSPWMRPGTTPRCSGTPR